MEANQIERGISQKWKDGFQVASQHAPAHAIALPRDKKERMRDLLAHTTCDVEALPIGCVRLTVNFARLLAPARGDGRRAGLILCIVRAVRSTMYRQLENLGFPLFFA